jgi:hypothetical protein
MPVPRVHEPTGNPAWGTLRFGVEDAEGSPAGSDDFQVNLFISRTISSDSSESTFRLPAKRLQLFSKVQFTANAFAGFLQNELHDLCKANSRLSAKAFAGFPQKS